MSNEPMADAVYNFICQHWQQFGYGPTLGEIATGCFTSKANVYRYLDRLEMEGRISRDAGRARSIKMLEKCPDSKK